MSLNNLGIRLSDPGRREEALQTTQEAVGLYRQLAAQRPDAFLPDLATSLGGKGAVLRAMGDTVGAVAAFQQGVECLKPSFLRLPRAFRPLMLRLVVDYIQACETARVEADSGLLEDIIPGLSDDTAGAAGA